MSHNKEPNWKWLTQHVIVPIIVAFIAGGAGTAVIVTIWNAQPATPTPQPTPTSVVSVSENNTLTPTPTFTLVPPPPTFTEEPPTYTPLPPSPTDTNTPLPTNTLTPTPVVAFVPRCGDQAWTVNFADNGTADVDFVFPQGYMHGFISSDPALVELPNGQSKQFSTQFVLIVNSVSSVKVRGVGARQENGRIIANTWGCIYGQNDAVIADAEAKKDYDSKLEKRFLAELYNVNSQGFTLLKSNVNPSPTVENPGIPCTIMEEVKPHHMPEYGVAWILEPYPEDRIVEIWSNHHPNNLDAHLYWLPAGKRAEFMSGGGVEYRDRAGCDFAGEQYERSKNNPRLPIDDELYQDYIQYGEIP